jgi:phage terminase large subunit-like protein
VGYSPDRVDALVWALTELSGPQHIVTITPLFI